MNEKVSLSEVQQVADMINNGIVPVSSSNIPYVFEFVNALANDINNKDTTYAMSRRCWDVMTVNIYGVMEDGADLGFIDKVVYAFQGYKAITHLVNALKNRQH